MHFHRRLRAQNLIQIIFRYTFPDSYFEIDEN